MKSIRNFVIASSVLLSLAACDNNNEIGSSIVADEVEIVTDSLFTVTGHSIDNPRVQSRTIGQLLGSIDAGEYGTLYSDFVTQFMPSAKIETEGVIIDGLNLKFSAVRSTGYVGDTLVPMGLEIYRLNKDLEYPIYSNFGEKVNNYYDVSSKPIASKIYNFSTAGLSDSIQALSYIDIDVDMPKELGQELFDFYLENTENYLIPERFAKKFPGLYVKSSYGDGRLIKIGATVMSLKYHINSVNDAGNDTTIYYTGNYYGVSPEIITNNNITYNRSEEISKRVAAGEDLLVAPIGLDIEMKFPINDILDSYLNGSGKLSVVNSLSFVLPVDSISNNYNIRVPQYVLMVRKDKKDEFFANNQITDNLTSFLGTYNSTYGRYEFPDMKAYLADRVKNGPATAAEETFILTPVIVNTETNSSSSYYSYYYGSSSVTVSSIVPYVETPVMGKISFEDAKIILSYSKQSLKM